MVFLKLNNDKMVNLLHVSTIELNGKDILFNPAKGSLDAIIEHFDTEEGAQTRYNQVKELVRVEVEEND